jgi:glycosyltransferase involved in cell wall biosynthesis
MKFTIIIPTYNYGRFITECLHSIIAQTYQNWECIIVDNASTDDTESVCRTFLKDERITYHKLPVNKGPSPARNYALGIASGDYILFLDSDDLIEDQKLEMAFKVIREHQADLVFTDYSVFHSDNRTLTETVSFSGDFEKGLITAKEIRSKLVNGNIFAISCIVTRKEILKAVHYFDENINYNEDWDLWLRVSGLDPTFYYDPGTNIHTLIRNHGSSHSKDLFAMYLAGLYVCKKNYDSLDKAGQDLFRAKINSHRHELKNRLIDFYFHDRLKFESAIQKLNSLRLLDHELTSYRKSKWMLPAFMAPAYLFLLKLNYYVLRKWS